MSKTNRHRELVNDHQRSSFFDIAFWRDFISNGLATLLGAVIGIPIALWINRMQEKREESSRKVKILKLIKTELNHNLDTIVENQPIYRGNPEKRVVDWKPFKDGLWRTLSDGGEIEWIKDIDLLDAISDAYTHIEALMFFEKLYWEVRLSLASRSVTDKKDKMRNITVMLGNIDYKAMDAINHVITEINKSLPESEN